MPRAGNTGVEGGPYVATPGTTSISLESCALIMMAPVGLLSYLVPWQNCVTFDQEQLPLSFSSHEGIGVAHKGRQGKGMRHGVPKSTHDRPTITL